MPSRKIAIMGAQHSGKTTLIKNISNFLKSKGYTIGLVEEVVRGCPYPINEMATLKAQDWVLEEQIKREKALEGKFDIIVLTDRCVLDNFAYWKRVAEKLKLANKKILKKEKEVFDHANTYSIVFFLQPFEVKKIEDDNFRSVDFKWREEMHKRISDVVKEFTSKCDVPVVYVKGNANEMFETAKKNVVDILN